MKVLTKVTIQANKEFFEAAKLGASNEIGNEYTELNSYEGYLEELHDAIKEEDWVEVAVITSLLSQAK